MYWESRLCREIDLLKFKKYLKQLPSLQEVYPSFGIPEGIKHRKNWEWGFIIYVLDKARMIKEGKRGLGFAVGEEPLPSYFAGRGVQILATDLWEENSSEQWFDHQNLKGNKRVLNRYALCSPEKFEKNLEIRNINMNSIPDDLKDFDFCWSSCAVEHVGSLDLGKEFFINQLNVLKSGGISVHTVEFNVSSNEDTIEMGDTAIFRKCDIENIAACVNASGGEMVCTFKNGWFAGDKFVDTPPYYHTNRHFHLHLDIEGYNCTSYGIVIRKK